MSIVNSDDAMRTLQKWFQLRFNRVRVFKANDFLTEYPGGHRATTVELKINFFRPVWQAQLNAEGVVVRRAQTTGDRVGENRYRQSFRRSRIPSRNPMPKFEKHIFICGNQRPAGNPRGCCDPAGQAKLQKLFKQKLAERGLKGKVRANQSGCLDQCEHGPNLVIYPDAVWYGHVTEADVDEIIESHIVGGKPVGRLMLADSCLNTATCEHRKENSDVRNP